MDSLAYHIRLSVHGEMKRGKPGLGSSPGVRRGRALSLAICGGGLAALPQPRSSHAYIGYFDISSDFTVMFSL